MFTAALTNPQERRLMTAQLDAFEAFWRQWFVSREGHFRAGFQIFSGRAGLVLRNCNSFDALARAIRRALSSANFQ